MSVRRVRNGIDESFWGGRLKRGGTQVEVFHFLCHDLNMGKILVKNMANIKRQFYANIWIALKWHGVAQSV